MSFPCRLRLVLIAAFTLSLAHAARAQHPGQPAFERRDAESGVVYPVPDEPAVGLLDYDLDGYVDLFIGPQLWRNNGKNRVERGPVRPAVFCSFGDFDNDGDLDVYATSRRTKERAAPQEKKDKDKGKEPPKSKKPADSEFLQWLLRREPDGTYKDVVKGSGLDELEKRKMTLDDLDVSRAHGFLDFDGDGKLDLFIAGGERLYAGGHKAPVVDRLLKGNGNGAFADVTAAAGLGGAERVAAAVAFCDFDNDGWTDIYVANDKLQPNTLWRNQGDGTFRDVTEEAGAGGGNANSNGVTVADFDLDGDFDLFVTNFSHDQARTPEPISTLLRNDLVPAGTLSFTDVTRELGLAWQPPTGYRAVAPWVSAVFADVNNDGWPDLFVTESMDGGANHPGAPLKSGRFDSGYSRLYLSRAAEGFTRAETRRNGLQMDDMAGVGAADVDNDGWIDLLVGSFAGRKAEKTAWYDPAEQKCAFLHGLGLEDQPGPPGTDRGYVNVTLVSRDRPLNGSTVEVVLTGGAKRRAVYSPHCNGYSLVGNQLHFAIGSASVQLVRVILPGGATAEFPGRWRNVTLLLDASRESPAQPKIVAPWAA